MCVHPVGTSFYCLRQLGVVRFVFSLQRHTAKLNLLF